MKAKEIILQKTAGLLLERGFGNVSVSDIQQHTGMARGLLYHYFGNQDRLFEDAVRMLAEQWAVHKETLKNHSIAELVVFLLGKYRQLAEKLPEIAPPGGALYRIPLLLSQASGQSEAMAALYAELNEQRRSVWKTAVLNSFMRNELRSGLNLESVTRHFFFLEGGIWPQGRILSHSTDLLYVLDRTWNEYFEIIRR